VGPAASDGSAYNVLFFLIVLVILTIIPMMIIWWVVVLRHLNRRSEAGIRAAVSRWHFLRYGPAAPLISAAVFLCGLSAWEFSPLFDMIPSSLRLVLFVMTGPGFIAFLISAVLCAFTRALERSIADAE
jgi:hypothetical protein